MGRPWREEGRGHEPARILCPGESRPRPGKRRLRPRPGKRRLRPRPGKRRLRPRPGKRRLRPRPGKRRLRPRPGKRRLRPRPGKRRLRPRPGKRRLRPRPGKRRLRPRPGKRRLRPYRAQDWGGKQNPTGKRGRPLGIPPPIRRTLQPVPGPGPHRTDRLCERRSGKLRVDRADPDGGRRTGDSGDSRAGGVGRRVPVGLRGDGGAGALRFCGMGTGREIRRQAGAPGRPLGGAS